MMMTAAAEAAMGKKGVCFAFLLKEACKWGVIVDSATCRSRIQRLGRCALAKGVVASIPAA